LGEAPAKLLDSPHDARENVSLSLVNVPISQAAKSVLSDIFGVKYAVDASIEGRVTIQTSKPVTRMAALDLFQAALRVNNAALVDSGDTYKIVPLDQMNTGAVMRSDGSGDKTSEQIGSGLQVVPLKYVSASEMRRVLEPIAPRAGIVRTDDARNIITLSGNRQELAAMMDAVKLFDVDVMKGMSFALVPVKTSQPDAIAGELRAVFATDREGPMAGMVQFLPNRRLSAILVISPQAQYLRQAETWIRRFDARAQGAEKQLFTYSVQNRQAQELVDVLQEMFANEIGGRRSANRTVAPPYEQTTLSSSKFQGANLPVSPRGASIGSGGSMPMREQLADAIEETPTPALIEEDERGAEPRVKLVADASKNAILIEATASDYQRFLRVLNTLDVMPKQVLIEATIAEVSLTDELRFGVRWYMQNGKHSGTFSDAASGSTNSVFPGFSYALAAANVTATFNMLNELTNVNVVSSPSLTVMDNKPAVLQIGDQVPITTQSAIDTTGTGSIINSVSYKDTGVILAITPRINESGRVQLDVEQEVSSVATTTSSGIDSPTIRQRRIRTSVVVNDGDALVLGGLIQDSKTTGRSQLPLLGRIPIIGNAMRYKNDEVRKTELIVVIAPHVIRDLNEAREITEEYRNQFEDRGARAKGSSNSARTVQRIIN
jgi:general secretion pathway protein D